MTVFGVDVSRFQHGLTMSSVVRQGYDFVIAKATEGRTVRDPDFDRFRRGAKRARLLFAAYHFLHSDSSARSQADNLAAALEGSTNIPIMIDCEPTEGSSPTMQDVEQFTSACEDRGLQVSILYLPRFHWETIGRPTLGTELLLVQALYGENKRGPGKEIYPGDESTRWKRMGGKKPDLLQFGSRGKLAGFSGNVDVDAYRGSLKTLRESGAFRAP